jgi:radical SAM superfamily enzyme YgiQ (UPF0313 family)
MKKFIALVFPKSTFLENPLTWIPLGLMYLGAQLEAQGHHCEFFDLNEDEMPKDGDFDQVWVSSTSPQIRESRRLAEEMLSWTKTKKVLGGAGAWANPIVHKEIPYDLVVAGEADNPSCLDYILECVDSPTDDRLIDVGVARGLSWVLPPLRRWSHKYHSYMKDKKTGINHRMSSVFTSRGCGKSCAFCESGRLGVIWSRLVRFEPLGVVEAQIKEIAEQGFTGIGFYDDILPVNKKRVREVLELLKKYNMVWRCFLRTDIICHNGGKEYLKEMRDGGLIECFVGIESASDIIKNNIHKGTSIEQDTKVLQWCKELDIVCKTSFIIGLPGESKDTLNVTRDWILANRPDIVQVDRLIPFSGTPLVDHAEEYDLKYETMPDSEWFFRGRHDINSKSFVSTSHLTVEEIDSFWHKLEQELIREGLSSYGH